MVCNIAVWKEWTYMTNQDVQLKEAAMTDDEFSTVFDEGYTEGYGSGVIMGGILGALAVVVIGLMVRLIS
jgi:hypothetical protein